MILLLLACTPDLGRQEQPGGDAAAVAIAPADPTRVRTRNGLYEVTLTLPQPVPLAELFSVSVLVRDGKSGAPVETATVEVDARMPQHGHGMATRPEADPGTCAPTCTHPGGKYVTSGMKFHMPGDWVVSVSVAGERGHDTVDIPVSM